MKGLIVKGIAGFYYVKSGDEVYRCKARGIFKARDIKPAVGDEVLFDHLPDDENSIINEILPRRNVFIRPFAANVDCFVVVAAVASPAPVLSVIDRFLVMAEKNGTEIILCINKCDLADPEGRGKARKAQAALEEIRDIYSPLYPTVFMNGETGEGLDELRRLIEGRKVALAGPSGVGKSTILNRLMPEASAETGDISSKSERGRHTTRHTELFLIDREKDTMIFDTPGFTSFDILEAEEDELYEFYPEMAEKAGMCRYSNCRHLQEPGCAVREAVEDGSISESRYASYRSQIGEIRKLKHY